MALERIRVSIEISGLVQGVGFRPFVYALALRSDISGFVLNNGAGLWCEAEGLSCNIDNFVRRLRVEAPTASRIDSMEIAGLELVGGTRFRILESELTAGSTDIPPDRAICDSCRREMFDPLNRRYLHPFISCIACGPRYSILKSLPFDRVRTTMSVFEMCESCEAEFSDPQGRRFYAQTVSCHDCGPKYQWNSGTPDVGGGAIYAARKAISSGGVIAVKGIGGYHLVCDASDVGAVSRIREIKRRGDKPLAVMVRDADAAGRLVEFGALGRAELTDAVGKILVARRRPDGRGVCATVAPGTSELGIMVPYSPIHHLLFGADVEILVVTSANRSGESIIYEDSVALEELGDLVDGLLTHDREIMQPGDDSVARLCELGTISVRESRGLVPKKMQLAGASKTSMLALGGDLKTAICMTSGSDLWISGHVGDMERESAERALDRVVARLSRLLHSEPRMIVVDSHPGYRTASWALRRAQGRDVFRVQHHHAHLGSLVVDAEVDRDQPVLGFIFDGSGYGPDGTIWGGEVLLGTVREARRVARLRPVPQAGGDSAARFGHRMALSHLVSADIPLLADLPPIRVCNAVEMEVLCTLIRSRRTILTSSMGRLFDAVSSICGVCHMSAYEAEAAMRFENVAREAAKDPAPILNSGFGLVPYRGGLEMDPGPVLRDIVAGVESGVEVSIVAYRFHLAVADVIVRLAKALSPMDKPYPVGLSGGVFLNCLLTELTVSKLVQDGFTVLRHESTPPSDASLGIGQAAIAAAKGRLIWD